MADEKLFEGQVKRFFHGVGIYPAGYPQDKMIHEPTGWYFKVWGGGFQKAGIPDIIACVNGVFMAVELKSTVGRPSELQQLNVSRINAVGGIGVILYPEGFGEFKTMVKGVINCDIPIAQLKLLKAASSSTKCVIWTK